LKVAAVLRASHLEASTGDTPALPAREWPPRLTAGQHDRRVIVLSTNWKESGGWEGLSLNEGKVFVRLNVRISYPRERPTSDVDQHLPLHLGGVA
jgi:hypothetical protein